MRSRMVSYRIERPYDVIDESLYLNPGEELYVVTEDAQEIIARERAQQSFTSSAA
jgi:hypothetical protein